AAAEQLAANKPGVRWLRTQLQITIRRNEEARQRLVEEVKQLVAKPVADDLFLATFVLGNAYGVTGWPEFLQIVQQIKPVFERPVVVDGQPVDGVDAMSSWNERLLQCYDALGRQADALALRKARSTAEPWQTQWQIDYAQRLATSGQFEAAHAWL